MRHVLVLSLALSACFSSEVGEYELESAYLVTASCTAGPSADQARTWTDAMSADPIDDLLIAIDPELTVAPSQAQLSRSSDGTVFWADLHQEGAGTFEGRRVRTATTRTDADLGADFSVLLEAGHVGCLFDLEEAIALQFDEGGWDQLSGTVSVGLTQTEAVVEEACIVSDCFVEYRFTASHTSASKGTRRSDAP